MTFEEIPTANPVVVSLADLAAGKVDRSVLTEAFGEHSLGIIVVKDLPQEYLELRKKVLLQATYLSKAPAKMLEEMEAPEGFHLTGWSRGKEILQNGSPDLLKGSYYINCSFYKDPQLEGPPKEETVGYEQFKAYTTWNKWPRESEVSNLENFQQNSKQLIRLMIDVSLNVCQVLDSYLEEEIVGSHYSPKYLQSIIKNSTTSKARLLHYYAQTEEEQNANDNDWCGEHLDHSCITALTSAMFLREEGDTVEILETNPDPSSGLYIKDRSGRHVKVNIPKDCLAFQSGSALEEVSSGQFKAVPHYVKGTSLPNVSRNTLAVFMQPSLHEKVNSSQSFAEFSQDVLTRNHSK